MTINHNIKEKVLELQDDGLSLDKIAQTVGISKGSTYNIVQRCQEEEREDKLKRKEASLSNKEQELKKRESAVTNREKDSEERKKRNSKREGVVEEREKRAERVFSLLKENNLKMEDLEDIVNNHQHYRKETDNLKSGVFRLYADINQKKYVRDLLQHR
jgi:transposase